ncbi:hypothetical protein HYDPIDRAFT_26627 [Hydnomerulius pinastri MD-312]|nr:hypothetical protein HYDPIDRAFT_26627 [Hydnomerulius pinastri MD-312]
MSGQAARTHNHLSNRAKVRSVLERKPVFKSVLENPFHIKWPSVPANLQNLCLARLMAALETMPARRRSAPNILPEKGKREHSCQENGTTTKDQPMTLDEVAADHASTGYGPGAVPALQHLTVGINQVTRVIESQLRLSRKHTVQCSAQPGDLPEISQELPTLAIVFVCYADIDPSVLVDHVPHLVAACNSIPAKEAAGIIKLIPLPKGSESMISQALGLRRAAVIGIHVCGSNVKPSAPFLATYNYLQYGSPLFATFQDILDSIPIVSAPWLRPSEALAVQPLVPTHIKQLRTTAPKDMKTAKEQRQKARTAKKKSSGSSRRKGRLTLAIGFGPAKPSS